MKTQVKFTDTDLHTGVEHHILGTIENYDGDYVIVIGGDNKFYKVHYRELTFVSKLV